MPICFSHHGNLKCRSEEIMKNFFLAFAAWLVAALLVGCPTPETPTPVSPTPIAVMISRSSIAFTDMSLLNLSATETGSTGPVTYAWYVNDALSSSAVNGSIFSLANNLPADSYSVDVVASDGTHSGTTNFSFQWKGHLSDPPSNASANWAYYDTKDGVPYFYSDSQTRQPFSTIPVHVASLASGSTLSSLGLGYDTDKDAPENAAGVTPLGFGTSSFYSDTTGISTSTRQYTSFRIMPQTLLGLQSLTLGDIRSVSFWTKQVSPSTRTWQLKLYTLNPNAVQGAGPGANFWYQTRINSVITSPSSAEWILNSTSTTMNSAHTILFDKITPYGQTTQEQKPSSPIGLDDVKSGIHTTGTYGSTYTASLIVTPHASEAILWMDISAGDKTIPQDPVKSYLDGVVITTTSGKALVLDLGD
jgi:hypothetical protein